MYTTVAPRGYHFNIHPDLMLEDLTVHHRPELVLDTEGIIRYVDIVPLCHVPDFEKTFLPSQCLIANVSR